MECRITSEVSAYADDIRALMAMSSSPYDDFVYRDAEQARAAAEILWSNHVVEFAEPHAYAWIEGGRVLGVMSAMPTAVLKRRRMASAMALRRSSLAKEDPALVKRIQLAGSTLLRPEASEFYFSRLAVDAAARGKGIGRALTAHVLVVARAGGFRRVVCEVTVVTSSAERVLAGLGFDVVDRKAVVDPQTDRKLEYLHMVWEDPCAG